MSQKAVALLVCFACVLLGVFILKLSLYNPLTAARVQGHVEVSEKGLFIGPLCVAFGFVGLCVVPFAKQKPNTRPPGPPTCRQQMVGTLIGLVVVVMFGAIGFALRAWLFGRLTALGYPV